jgi:hypothetical protein
MQYLFKIQKILMDPITGRLLSQSSIEHLFYLIASQLFRPIPAFRGPHDISEIRDICVIKDWPHIELLHQIFQFLMTGPFSVSTLIGSEFVSRLIRQSDSPVFDERHEIEVDLRIILQLYKHHRRIVLGGLLSKLIAFLEGVRVFTSSIGAVLRLFLHYFENLREPITQSHFLMFRTVFLSTFWNRPCF